GEGRQERQDHRVGGRAHEPQSPALVWLDEQDGEGGRPDLCDRIAREERRAVDDREPRQAPGRARNPIMRSGPDSSRHPTPVARLTPSAWRFRTSVWDFGVGNWK